ncbi:MAG: flagellar protein FlgN [Pseudomonadales bacterium]|jgi:flagellar biosynthesis/type III secretory pathway chaperone|nr:flagellar protein FlgN [Pseudomonadales bacterium]
MEQSIEVSEALEALLDSEVGCARTLLDSLKAESAALASKDARLVTINSANKRKMIDKLQAASEARINFMSEHGLSTRAQDMHSYDPGSASNARLDARFIELSQLAQKCFDENRVIGQLINRRSQFISQILRSLSPSADLQGLTYKEDGNPAAGARNNMFYQTKI